MKHEVQKFLEYLHSVKNSSPHTISNYANDLAQFVAYLTPPGEKTPALTAVDHSMIREFVAHLHEHGLEKTSIARKLAALRSFFKYCVREGLLKENPARLVPTPKLPKRIPSVLSAEEMGDFLNQLAEEPKRQSDSAAANPSSRSKLAKGSRLKPVPAEEGLLIKRDRALLELLYAAGLRVSEVVNLKPADIDSHRLMVRVEQAKGAKDRYTILSPRLLEELRLYWKLYRPTTWLFPSSRDPQRQMHRSRAQKIYYEAKRRAGITRGHGIHTLRHCFATHLLEAGLDLRTIQSLMGHTSVTTTMRYLQVRSFETRKDLLDLLSIPESQPPQ